MIEHLYMYSDAKCVTHRSRILEPQYLHGGAVNQSWQDKLRWVAMWRASDWKALRQVHLARRASVLRHWPRTDWHTTLRWRCSAPSQQLHEAVREFR